MLVEARGPTVTSRAPRAENSRSWIAARYAFDLDLAVVLERQLHRIKQGEGQRVALIDADALRKRGRGRLDGSLL